VVQGGHNFLGSGTVVCGVLVWGGVQLLESNSFQKRYKL
jgi:hypothetical protein